MSPRYERLLLLGLSLLTGCAAGGIEADRAVPQASNAYGAYLMGRFAQDSNDLGAAASNLLVALAHNPDDPALLNQAFLACLLDGRPEAAMLATRLPDNPIAQLLVGNDAARRGDWRAARATFEAVKTPGLAELLTPLLVAWTQLGAADTDGALATLKPRLSGQGFVGLFALQAGLIADLGNRFTLAQQYYNLAQSNYGGINLQLARILANWDLRQGRKDDAVELVHALGRSAPSLAILVPGMEADLHTRPVRSAIDGLAEVYLSFAAELRQQRDSADTSLALLQLALNLRPDFTAARLVMADALAGQKHPATALRVLSTIGNKDPLSPLVRLRRADLEADLGDYQTAEAGLRQLAAEFPARPEPLAALADLQRAQKQIPNAIATYGQAIARDGGDRNWTLYFARAVSEQQTGNWPGAETDLRRALAISPDQPDVLNFLGFSWADRDEHLDEARTMLTKAVELRPNDGAIIDSLGWVDLRQGKTDEAVKLLERAVKLQPEDPEINGHLGDAYWAAGRKLQARYQWQLALNFKPEPAAAIKIRAKLADAERATR